MYIFSPQRWWIDSDQGVMVFSSKFLLFMIPRKHGYHASCSMIAVNNIDDNIDIIIIIIIVIDMIIYREVHYNFMESYCSMYFSRCSH
jgi:hypothetical protein